MNGALVPYQVPRSGVGFFIADFRDDEPSSHVGRNIGWTNIRKTNRTAFSPLETR